MLLRRTVRFLSASSPTSAAPGAATASPTSDETKFIGMTGAQIFHEMMKEHKVDTIFGYPGGAILPVFDAIHDSKNFKFILPRHEQGAGHMAEGYARVTGKPGIVLVTSGPGATNTVTPLMDAFMDGTPLIVFTGQVPTSAMGTDAFQEADVIGITRHCTKWNVLVKDIRDLPRRINEAFFIATNGRPGPVLVDLPKDVTAGVLRAPANPTPQLAQRTQAKMARTHQKSSDEDFERIAAMINNAKRPIIYCGQGVAQSTHPSGERIGPDVLRKLAVQANIPVTTTLQGMGNFDENHPLSLHMLGMHGSAYANMAIQNADVIVALGARFDDRVTLKLSSFAPKAKLAEQQGTGGIVHFEISPKNMNKVVKPTEAVFGDVTENMLRLAPLLTHQPRTEWMQEIKDWKAKLPFHYPAAPQGLIRPQAVLEELDRQTKGKDVIITTGVGQHQMWATQYIRWTKPRTLITSGGAGTMGFGVPSAIGAKVASPQSIVVDIDGDASYSMTCQEMLTAAEYGIGVKILILNNHFQGMVKQWQDLFYEERYSGTTMVNPDFAKLADAMGCKGIRLDRAEDLESKMKEFLDYPGPVVMDAQVLKETHLFPMVPAGKALHEMVFEAPSKKN
ncbi:acetolactate synthase, large subunit, biosynthetic type [Batrachochytrium salamandrivorans]|nr:acetolactate synthase, large subunit, biosynthetic type [Batrachochytrium salamandrivorans]